VIATEGDEVEVSCVLVSDEVVGHGWMVDERLVDWKPRIGNWSGTGLGAPCLYFETWFLEVLWIWSRGREHAPFRV
jgi:hypothetical protein